MTYFVSIWAELFILATGQPMDWEGAQPSSVDSGEMEGWGGRDIQDSGQQPWAVPRQKLLGEGRGGGQFPLEGALSTKGTVYS